MIGIFRLIRLRTLLFAVYTMCVMRYYVLRPVLEVNGLSLQMSVAGFILLLIAVCCLISGASVINDYFDTKIDRLSGVRDVVVGKHISRRTAILIHSALNLTAVVIAFYLSFAVGVWKIGIFFLLISGLLWFYSSTYKKYFITGNLLIAFLAALIPFSVLIFEIPLLNQAYGMFLLSTGSDFLYLFKWIGGFAYFAFWNTLMYEINKDLYTVAGDRESGIHTLPVRLGVPDSRKIIAWLARLCILSLIILFLLVFREANLILGYFLFLLFAYSGYTISMTLEKTSRSWQLRMIYAIMAGCVSFAFLLNYYFTMK